MKSYRFIAVLCCILLLSACAPSAPESEQLNQKYKLTQVHYPMQTAFPQYNNEPTFDHDAYVQAQSLWQQAQVDRRAKLNETTLPTDFLRRSVKEVLGNESGENVAYSPTNFYMALALLAETTSGESRAQILKLLGQKSLDDLRTQANCIWQANYRDDGRYATTFANALFLNEDLRFKQAALDNAARYHYADIFRGPMDTESYDKTIQQWINEKTRGLLAENVKSIETEEDTSMVLLSTLYFQSRWKGEFWEGANTQDVFHTKDGDKTVEFMHKTSTELPYYQSDDYSAVCCPFDDGSNMWLLLPNEDVDVVEVARSEKLLDPIFTATPTDLSNPNVILSIPKFDFSCSNDLIGTMQKMGVTDVFYPETADFSALLDLPAYLEIVRHDVRVLIDEEGCKAAAFTEMLQDCGAVFTPPPDEVIFTLDRPFVFIIASDTNMPLFVGTVQNP